MSDDSPPVRDRLQDAAMGAMDRGWPIFPVSGKKPATANGLHDATTDRGRVHTWWGPSSDHGLALSTGEPAGVWVLDLDGEKGKQAVLDLQKKNGPLPETTAARTGGGGFHLFFRMPEDRDVRNSAGKVAEGVDVRGTGGYVVLPPSPHPSGNCYEWVEGRAPDEASTAPAPDWLLQLVTADASKNGRPAPAEALPEAIPAGQRNETLASLAGSMRRRGASREAMRAALHEENKGRCDPPLPEGEVDDIAASIERYEPSENGASPAAAATTVRLSDVEPEEVRWLWPDRIPLGKLTMLDGDPGLLKSTLTIGLAARLSVGAPMPDGAEPELDGPAGTVLLTAEDGLADTVRPRLDAAGGDPDRVVVVKSVVPEEGEPRLPHVGDTPELEAAVRSVQARLMVVDPLMAFLPEDVNSHRDQDVRRALSPLAELADHSGAAIVSIRHLNKSGGSNPKYRGGGSIGLIGAARSGLLVAEDPDAPDTRRVLATTKANLSEPASSLSYRAVEADNGAVRVEWEGESDRRAGELLDQPDADARTKAEEAERWLEGELSGGARPVKQLKREVGSLGFAWRTVERAKDRLNVDARREGGIGAEGRWVWELPDKGRQDGWRTKGATGMADIGGGPRAQGSSGGRDDKGRKSQSLADIGGECRECGRSIGPSATVCGTCRREGEA